MRYVFMTGLLCLFFAACTRSNDTPATSTEAPVQSASEAASTPKGEMRLAFFAGGCFWGVEHYLEKLEGVHAVESGYMGGTVESPSYQDVLTKQSGHYEAVRVRYDPSRVNYRDIAKLFFEIHDPTQANGQGPDIGPQYRSAVFVQSAEEKQTALQLIEQLKARGYDVVTEVKPVAKFWTAEDYHQDYYVRTGKAPYCHRRIRRFGD